MRTTGQYALLAVVVGVLAACPPENNSKLPPPVSPTNHAYFPIQAGSLHALGTTVAVDGEITCASCHAANATSYTEFQCVSCHKHSMPMTNRLHLGVTDYVGTNAGCYQCHADGADRPFSHTGIAADATGLCAECHAVGAAFAALPIAARPTFVHQTITSDCGGCHQDVTDWAQVTAGGSDKFDPTRSLTVNALQPTWVQTSIISVTPDPQVIDMTMNHGATSVIDAGVLADCAACHAQADQGQYYPGVMHWSLANLGVPQPTTCAPCHGGSAPSGFTGALDGRRSPSTGEMHHDAVDRPTMRPIVTMDCGVCHQTPDALVNAQWTFARGRDDGGTTLFHLALTESAVPQPTACLDCHANSRPVTPVVNATFTFDHSTALGECSTCHTSTTQWAGGKFHSTTAPAPTTCLPCHAGDRPTSTAGWVGPYLTSPFDFVTNANGVTHGADQDCAICHAGPGTGMWGVNQNWRSGRYAHATTTAAGTTCIECHTTQRPDLLIPAVDAGYDHASSGTGDCFACHQATVTRGVYVNLLPIPGGDWRGGQSYPGDALISTPGRSVRLQSTTLNRTGAMVTSMTTGTANLPNAFLHTSAAIPAAISPGSAAAPDQNSCWHCHTSTGTTVTAYSNGVFHSALMNFKATPTSAITPLPEPTVCLDCHGTMRPPNVVSKTDAGTPWILPMDHAATFTGGSVTGVAAMDCGACHRTPGLGPTLWSDGKFHPNLPTGAQPSECVSCHYPVMTTPQADVTFPDAGTPSTFSMKHRSSVITTQACATCHTNALTRSTTAPTTTLLWRPGGYHPNAGTQPTTCLDCHSTSDPVTATQGTAVYVLSQGGTPTNGAQWMNHTHATVSSKDCAACHQADARATGSAWNRGTPYHSKVTGLTTCAPCHGTTNGRGTTVGTNNNLPAGLIDSATTTTSSASPGVRDQLAHTDLNVTSRDCNFCHTQVGPSTVAGVQGREWSKAVFHRSFTTASPMLVNGTTARCSNCHLNVKPGPAYTQQDHSGFTATSTQDCAACHSWPGTGTATAPNWLGATGAHAASGPTATSTLDCNTCHGQNGNSSKHLLVPAAQHYGGITNGNKCTSCHIDFAGFKGTIANLKYAHTNATANAGQGCGNCHVFSASLYTTLTNTPALTFPTTAGGHQFSATRSVTGQVRNCADTNPNGCVTSTHANSGLNPCGACHQYAPTTAATNIWSFVHRTTNPGMTFSRSSSGCTMCH